MKKLLLLLSVSLLVYFPAMALEPVADNSTAEGMRRNRRVEITILEN